MAILVTGGAGFIGSHVSEYYLRMGETVTVFDNLKRDEFLGKRLRSSEYNWEFLKSFSKARLKLDDIRNFDSLKNATSDCDVIIHTAAQVAVTTSLSNPRLDFEVNNHGAFNVLEAARINDCAVVYSSTNKVYGENVNKIPVIEEVKEYVFDDPAFKLGIPEDYPIDLTKHSPYGCSKLSADIYVQDYAHTYGLKTAVFRQSCIYGERQFGVEDQGWLAWFAIALLTGQQITIYGNGKQVRDVLYVDDLVECFDTFLKSHLTHGVFNVGGGPENRLSLLQLLSLLEDITGLRAKVTFADWRPADQRVYVSNISKLKQMLGWSPRVTPVDGVKKLVRWVVDRRDSLMLGAPNSLT